MECEIEKLSSEFLSLGVWKYIVTGTKFLQNISTNTHSIIFK